MSARIEGVGYIGWKGIIGCEVLELDKEALTGLIGSSGAGKTTLVMCLDYALLPDRRALHLQPISEVEDIQQAGIDILANRIDSNYGYAYVALDITTREDQRLVAGIYVEPINGTCEFSRWYINNVPRELLLQDLLGLPEGDNQYYPAFDELKRSLARKSIDVVKCKSVSEYCERLYDAGILPSNMTSASDRRLYANLIESTFKGGISKEITSNLKEYLLPDAHHIPEIIRGLEECTNELIKTRRAVQVANNELDILRATYGVGKEIIFDALRWLHYNIDTSKADIEDTIRSIENRKLEITTLTDTIAQVTKELDLLDVSQETSVNGLKANNEETQNREREKRSAQRLLDTELADILNRKSDFLSGEETWRLISSIYSGNDVDSASAWFGQKFGELHGARALLEKSINEFTETLHNLTKNKVSSEMDHLVKSTNGLPLDLAVKDLNDNETLRTAVALGGTSQGVVGVDISALSGLRADDLPDFFWVGKTLPTVEHVSEQGDWLTNPVAGGHIVFNKHHLPSISNKSLLQKQKHLTDQIQIATNMSTLVDDELADVQLKQAELNRKRKELDIFFSGVSLQELDELSRNKDAQREIMIQEIEELAQQASAIVDEIVRVQRQFEATRKSLDQKLNSNRQRQSSLQSQLQELADHLQKAKEQQGRHNLALARAKDVLKDSYDSLYMQSLAIEFNPSVELLVKIQTQRMGALIKALSDESSQRLQLLQDINTVVAVDTVQLWPLLIDIVRERVDIDLADHNEVALIERMQERRFNLDKELVKQEQEVKIKARNIYRAISSNIQTQKRKIEKLSEFGKEIAFGNVEGIQIKLLLRDALLATLEAFSEQMPIFANGSTVDGVLQDFFSAARSNNLALAGEQLLDYRSYVDLVIEAKRKSYDWAPAASLSGGESIGCGLAIALMLTRSIAARGVIKADQIHPLYAIDEVQRLHGDGQTMLVEFANREKFQIIVTATTLEPQFRCTLYALHRSYHPQEQLIIRGMKYKDRVRA